jgi:hypothetical protein
LALCLHGLHGLRKHLMLPLQWNCPVTLPSTVNLSTNMPRKQLICICKTTASTKPYQMFIRNVWRKVHCDAHIYCQANLKKWEKLAAKIRKITGKYIFITLQKRTPYRDRKSVV